MTMVVPMLVLAVGIVLLGVFNGDVVSGFLDPAVPADFTR